MAHLPHGVTIAMNGFVDGTVRIDGGRVRITAELSDASTQETVWSDTYDRQLTDVLSVQSDVALHIARALHAKLSPHEQQRLELRIELAAAAMLKGDEAGALEWLSRAVDAGFRDDILLERDPIFAPLTADQRFRDALQRIRRNVATQRTRAAERGLMNLDVLIAPVK